MFIELIATIVAGLAGAGVMMLITRSSGGRLPRWLVPVAGGAAMIAVTVSNEYGWFGRTSATLPEGAEIIETVESRALYRPWTYVFPYTDRFVAVDMAGRQSHADHPEQRIANVYFFGRWAPVNRLSVLADCADGRRAVLTDAAAFTATGTVETDTWVKPPEGDALIAALCRGV